MIQRPVVCPRLVARESELAFLNAQRLLAGKSNGRLVVIAGEAGIGKSRLLKEFSASLAQSRWKIGFGASLEYAQRPYGPILDVLDACEGKRAPLEPTATKREQFDAIAERLARIAAKTATLGLIEDIHWADSGTLELLDFLSRSVERRRVLLVATLRPHQLGARHPNYTALANVLKAARHTRLDLGPLGDSALNVFIDETLAEEMLPLQTRRQIARTSEGNPFFTEELLKAALEREATRSHREIAPLPSSLRATLLERYGMLEADDRAVLAQAAVIGQTFGLALLARTLERSAETLLPALQRARDQQLIEEVSRTAFRFRHVLTRRAIYEEFLGAQAQALHRTIAFAIQNGAEPPLLGELAYHWWAAGDGARSAHFNDRAGDAAAEVHAHEDAIVFYERALESAELDVRAKARIVEKIADRYLALGAPDLRHATYMQAAQLYAGAGDDDNEAQCTVRGVISAYTAGKVDSLGQLDALLNRLPAHSSVARARVHLGIAWLQASFSSPHEAKRHLEAVEASALNVVDIAQRYHNVAAWIAMTLGDVDAFRREFALWVEASQASKLVGAVASARLNGGACFSILGLHDEAIAQCRQSVELAREERNVLGQESAYANLAISYLQMGNIPAAREALAALPAIPESSVTLANASAVGTALGLHVGDDALMDRWFEPAGEALITYPEADSGAGYAEILLRRGRAAEARAALHRALPNAERIRGNMRTLVAVARFGAAEDCAPARKLLATAADSPSDLPEKPALALFDAYMAQRAGDVERTIALASVAAEGFARLRFALLEATALEAAGASSEARAVYERCGAAWDARRLRGTSADVEAPEALLSTREHEIASLVTGGKSNVEIARTLAISHKTVEKHLSSIYRKLGTSSRVQLAVRLGKSRRIEQR